MKRLVIAFALVATACGGGDDEATDPSVTTTATAVTTTTLTATTTTTDDTPVASRAALLESGDEGPRVRALQYLLGCGGWGEVVVDGIYGPQTAAAVSAFQDYAGREATGAADEALIRDSTGTVLGDSCLPIPVDLAGSARVTVGYFAGGGMETIGHSVDVTEGQTLTVAVAGDVAVSVVDDVGADLAATGDAYAVASTGQVVVLVDGPADAVVPYAVTIRLASAGEAAPASVVDLREDGLVLQGDGGETVVEFGDDPEAVLDAVLGAVGLDDPEFDTGWQPAGGIDEEILCRAGATEVRWVGIWTFDLIFWDAVTSFAPGGGRHWTAYSFNTDVGVADRPPNVPEVATAQGVVLGDGEEELVAAGGEIEGLSFVLEDPAGDDLLGGDLHDEGGYGPVGTVASIEGGVWCDSYDTGGLEAFKP